jgi:hypothetical protein
LVIALAGCQKKAQPDTKADSITNEAEGAKGRVQKLVTTTPAEEVPIDRALTDSIWYEANKNYIARETTTRYYVDANLIDIADVPTWMGTNDTRIVFPEFYATLEAHSKITPDNSPNYDAIMQVADSLYKELTMIGLKNKLMDPAVGLGMGNQYDFCFKVMLTSTGVTITKNSFEFADAVFSVPLINAIVNKNNLSSPKFSFATISVNGVTTTFCKVTAKGFVGYYDLTHKPKIK